MDKKYILAIIGVVIIGYLVYLQFFSCKVEPIVSPSTKPEIIEMIKNAKEKIWIENYMLTSEKVADELILAKLRGVDVRVILEKRVYDGKNIELYWRLKRAGVNVRWASEEYKLTHSKLFIIDNYVIVGSHNMSDTAMYENREISVRIRNCWDTLDYFLSLFEEDWDTGSV